MTPLFEYILLGITFVLWLLAMLRNLEYRRLTRLMQGGSTQDNVPLPSISIIVVTCEQADMLKQHLHLLLGQEYDADFEVIVVDINSTDDTPILLERMQEEYPNLHVIRTPETARDISPVRLALTLGIRSANYEWMVLTTAECRPASQHWLTRMGQSCAAHPETQIVLGVTRFASMEGDCSLCSRFFRTWQQIIHLPWAERKGAYRVQGANLCYRRSLFHDHRGFANHANLLTGAVDIMVNQQSTAQNTALCLHPEAHLLQEVDNPAKRWHQERLFFMETRRHFTHRFGYRLRYLRHVLLTWLFTLCMLAAVVNEAILQHYYVLGGIVLLWVIHAWRRAHHFADAVQSLGERPFTFSHPFLLHLVAWWDVKAWTEWLFTNKKTFKKKFI